MYLATDIMERPTETWEFIVPPLRYPPVLAVLHLVVVRNHPVLRIVRLVHRQMVLLQRVPPFSKIGSPERGRSSGAPSDPNYVPALITDHECQSDPMDVEFLRLSVGRCQYPDGGSTT
jgi:hypothetical protein